MSRFELKGPDALRMRMSEIQGKLDRKFGPKTPLVPDFKANLDQAQNRASDRPMEGAIGGVMNLEPMRIDGFQLDPSGPDGLRDLVKRISSENGIDPKLVEAVISVESAFNPTAVSSAGAKGLMQLMPGTAKQLGVTDPFDPEQNIRGGSRYLKQLMSQFGDLKLAIAAYNAGPGNVRRHGGIPPFKETQDYVRRVTDRYQILGGVIGG